MKLRFLKPGLLALLLCIQPVFWGCSGASEDGEEVEATDNEQAASVNDENAEYSENSADENYESDGGDTNEEGAYAESGEEEYGATGETDSDLQQIISELNQGNAEAPVNLSANAGAGNAAVVGSNVMEAATGAVAMGTSGQLPEPGSKMPYVVQTGDTLAKISAKIYGSGDKWPEIQQLSNIKNPSKIYPGEVVYYQLNEQTQTFATTYENAPVKEVTIGQGDSLSSIAAKVYGSAASWKTIWRQNGNIANPDRVSVGTVIYYVDYAAIGMTAKIINAEEGFKSVSKGVTGHSFYQMI